LSLLFAAHPRVTERYRQTSDEVVTTLVTRIEILEGRFASIIKAENGEKLLRSQERLYQSERNLSTLLTLSFDTRAARKGKHVRNHTVDS
jgi:tRNA(fMet)-specific endonuclease VapC